MANVHNDRLIPSPQDMVELGAAVEVRFVELLATWLRDRKEKLIPPDELSVAMVHWRTMRMRHKKGDYRHTGSEEKATREVAQWTVDASCILKNQESKDIEWAN